MRNQYKHIAEQIANLHRNGIIPYITVQDGSVEYTVFCAKVGHSTFEYTYDIWPNGVLYIEERFEDICTAHWLLSPEEVTVGEVFRAIYPRKAKWWAEEYEKELRRTRR